MTTLAILLMPNSYHYPLGDRATPVQDIDMYVCNYQQLAAMI